MKAVREYLNRPIQMADSRVLRNVAAELGYPPKSIARAARKLGYVITDL
jgi:DNA-binding MurR/RpiR family transcriptional regulator